MAQQSQDRQVGDTKISLDAILRRPGEGPVDLTGETVEFTLLKQDGTVKVARTSDNVSVQPTTQFTREGSRLVSASHRLQDGMAVLLSSTGTLPAGLPATRVFVVGATVDSFAVASTPGGPAIEITDAGTGTHSYLVVGNVQYAFQALDVDEAGKFYPYFIRSDSGDDTFPVEPREMVIHIKEP